MKSKLFEVKARAWVITFAILITYHLSLVTSTAQTFTQRVQQKATGQGVVIIQHDKSIDDLVNGKGSTSAPSKSVSKSTAKSSTTTTNTNATKEKPKQRQEKTTPAPKAESTTQPQPTASNDTTSAPAAPRHSYKTTGFRVQAFAGGNTRYDRQKAEQTGNTMRQLFPGTDVYVRFYSPRWVCRVGNYRTYEEAREVLLSVRKQGYESATIVKGKIVVYQ